jgi:hypothetical protein
MPSAMHEPGKTNGAASDVFTAVLLTVMTLVFAASTIGLIAYRGPTWLVALLAFVTIFNSVGAGVFWTLPSSASSNQ